MGDMADRLSCPPNPTCPIHTDIVLQCPACIGAKGGSVKGVRKGFAVTKQPSKAARRKAIRTRRERRRA